MDESGHGRGSMRFGEFEADLDAGELRKNGVRLHLQDQPFQVLAVLLRRPGQLMKREELRREVWPQDTFVEFDQALNTAIKKIRIALEDAANAPRFVETIPRKGYRFIAEINPPVSADGVSNVVSSAGNDAGLSRWRVIGGVAAVVLLLLLGLWGVHRTPAAQEHPNGKIVLAVLPFENWSDGVRQKYLCAGVTEELITQLSSVDPARLTVAAHTAVQPYEHTSKSVAQIGRELHVDFIMEGSLRSERQHLRVSAELIRVSDQARIWGDDFDREDGDLLALERELAASIGASAKEKMLPGGR